MKKSLKNTKKIRLYSPPSYTGPLLPHTPKHIHIILYENIFFAGYLSGSRYKKAKKERRGQSAIFRPQRAVASCRPPPTQAVQDAGTIPTSPATGGVSHADAATCQVCEAKIPNSSSKYFCDPTKKSKKNRIMFDYFLYNSHPSPKILFYLFFCRLQLYRCSPIGYPKNRGICHYP